MCNIDGTTYNNVCELFKAGCEGKVQVSIVHEGECVETGESFESNSLYIDRIFLYFKDLVN